ncbi:hypothetical protein ILUMI_06257 [Ignelater luminosus]|uniref:PiggyBac transposable element-derived protein domain-containing protein n=1 Tax=Ignelater luminosus TaxID=2038154 RepID=A0A8K0D5M0_IGNLU|nr:hypothetical protein ILUMI_06257 [Ignelater luminosus]
MSRRSREDYYCTDQQLYEILMSSDSEDGVLDEEDEDGDGWDNVSEAVFSENENNDVNGNYSSKSTNEDKVIVQARKKNKNGSPDVDEPYWGNEHRLFTDNWYTGPLLYEFFFNKKINCCGTIKSNRHVALFEKKNVKGKVQHFFHRTIVSTRMD